MRKISNMMICMQNKARQTMNEFVSSERGDTNFVSMLLIIGSVVVFAGLFLTLGEDVMDAISDKVKDFIDGL